LLATSLRVSFSLAIDGWNRCGFEAAMAREKDCGEHEGGASMKVEEGVIWFLIRCTFKGGISEECIMALGVSP
jgi:hypothetical protein